MSNFSHAPQKMERIGIIAPFPGRNVAQDDGAKLTREQQRTLMLQETLPAGITIGVRSDGRGKPWYVRFGTDRHLESFATERDRNDRAHTLAGAVTEQGSRVLDFDPAEWRRLQQFRERTGMTLDEAEEIVLRVKGNLRLNLTVAEAAERYIAMRVAEGLPALSQLHPKLHLKRFAEKFGPITLIAIQPEHVREWLDGLKAHKFGPVTIRHHRKNLNVFFERAKAEKWCLENPCTAVVPPRVVDQDTSILSPAEIFRLLAANRDWPVVGRIALELFGGMRCASVERVEAEHVKTDRRGLEMPGAKHKSSRRKYRQGHPPVLWEWIQHAGPEMFTDITEKNYDERKKAAFIRAGWDHVPHNRLRHSFASYMLAITKKPPLVGYLMQHSSLKMLERYEGIADENDARLVLSMSPFAVSMPWERFVSEWPAHYTPFVSLRPAHHE